MDRHLEEFSYTDITNQQESGLFRRASDRRMSMLGRNGERSPALVEGNNTFPVSIFTLGRFSLLIDGQPADFGRKVPKRPLELLKAIVAQGGREISISRLTVLLWPDVDGDKATRSFDTTLHRLRKLLGDDRVLVLRDGKLSLDARYCWVDVWTFERILGETKRVLKNDMDDNQVRMLDELTECLLELYQDHFLNREEVTSWSVSMRERLRSKFIHHLIDIGRSLEAHGKHEQAIVCYQKGIDVDDLVEVFYQRLMSCYLGMHRSSEGMLIYRRCRQTLSIMLGLQPEPETEALYLALRNTRLDLQSA